MRKIIVLLLFPFLLIVSAEAFSENQNLQLIQPTFVTAEYEGVELNIITAEIVNTELAIFGSSETTQMKLDGYLLITLEIKNNTKAALNYLATVINSFLNARVSLDDDAGGHYYRINAKESSDEGQIIYPGKSIQIKLSFQKPSAAVQFLTLSFPKYNIMRMPKDHNLKAGKEHDVFKLQFDAKKITVAKLEKPYSDLLFGDVYAENDLVIKISNADMLKFDVPKEGEALREEKNWLVISYEFINDNEKKIVDFNGGFQFKLEDEFNNEYFEVDPESETITKFGVDGVEQTVESLSPSRVYPGESYKNRVFFEGPILKTAKYLILTLDASNIGIKKKIKVNIPTDKIQSAASISMH